ncbi:MAG: serine hydrolase, partial [Halomonas sp.]|uniref:serine hydrolase n=1 Tax=Halomonas sp. TaxID=1486246 RepID=UPI003F8F49C8
MRVSSCFRSFRCLTTFLVGVVLAGNVLAQSTVPAPDKPPVPPVMIPSPPSLAASSWLLVDAGSGRILAEHNADERLPPASLTKLMTAYLVERELDSGKISLNDLVPISERAWRMGGSKMFIEVDTQVSVSDLLHGVVIVSGNDASVAMAEYLAGGEAPFADIMNQHADRLGMTNTHFMNATGLPDPGHYSSARDLANLSRHIIEDYPEHYQMYAQKQFTFGGIEQSNRNRLLWRDASVDGLKTGWTNEAGFCLVASAERDDMRLISVVMGTSSDEARAQETQKLLSYGFRYFETVKLDDAGAQLGTTRVWGGDTNTLSVGVDKAVMVTLPRDRREEITTAIDIQQGLDAPIQKGQVVGLMTIKLGNEIVGER